MSKAAAAIGRRRLYLCTPDRPDLEQFAASCIKGGVDVVQLREKSLSDGALVKRARLLHKVCAEHGVPLILNDRPDLVVAAEADGVHVGQDDVAPVEARRLVGPEAIVGLSTHDSSQLLAALDEPVDYISVGPVVPTPTKPGRPGTGLAYITEAWRQCSSVKPPLPFFVTGDARPATVAQMAIAGARRFVAVRWLTGAADPRAAAYELRRSVEEAIARAGDRAPHGAS
ncbi:MAG: thiamine phosphate synthase [Acidimicrobiales bacterium]